MAKRPGPRKKRKPRQKRSEADVLLDESQRSDFGHYDASTSNLPQDGVDDDLAFEDEMPPPSAESEATNATSDEDTTAAKKEPRIATRHWHWTNLLRTRSQIALSLLAGVAATVVATAVDPLTFSRVADLSLFLTLLLGIASVLALVGSITFGYLLHYAETLRAEESEQYGHFRSEVKDLRTFLDRMYEQGLVGSAYDYHLGFVEEITRKDFPLFTEFGERIDPLLKFVKAHELELDEEHFGRLLRGFAYRLNTLEEINGRSLELLVKKVLVERLIEPVVKSFVSLAVVMLLLILATAIYDLVPIVASWSAGIAVAFMTLMLVVEIAMTVRREFPKDTGERR